MTADLFLAIIFFILAVWLTAWFVRRCYNHQAKTETQTYTFTAEMKYAKLKTLICFEQTPENLFERHSRRVINLWAIKREELKNTEDFQLALEAEIVAKFPTCFPRVMSVEIIDPKPVPQEAPVQKTPAEMVRAELLSDADTLREVVHTIIEVRESRKELWSALYPGSETRPLGHHLDTKADDLIRHVLNGPKRKR